ncbi:MAG: DUF6320 domain-containing protein [Eubacteriales bacterium]|nr:DUF6320 domain-containing protein [Eubacteriales bacterium]
MPYCVLCGVETDEKSCPLCETPIVIPNKSGNEECTSYPYPDSIDEIYRKIDIKYARHLSMLIMALPAAVVLLVNLISSGAVTWSLYVIGALICLYCWVLVPVFYRFKRPYPYVAIDIISLTGYIFVIAKMTDGMGWFLGLALPLTLASFIYVLLTVLSIRRLEWQPLVRAASTATLTGIFLMAIDAICDLYVGQVYLNWSLYALLPLLALSALFLMLEKKKSLKKEIKKRLFF